MTSRSLYRFASWSRISLGVRMKRGSLSHTNYSVFSITGSQNYKLYVAGIHLPKVKTDELKNLIKWCLRHHEGPEMIGRLLTRTIQEVADKSDYVGKDIMCTFVPRTFSDSLQLHLGGMLFNPPAISTEPQRLEPVAVKSVHDRFTFPPPFDAPRFEYFAGDNKAFPYYTPTYTGLGYVLPSTRVDAINIIVSPVNRIPDHG